MKKKISILGATGSIGRQTLDVIRSFPHQFKVLALSGHSNVALLAKQVQEFRPRLVAVPDGERATALLNLLGDTETKVVTGEDGLIEVATQPETDLLVTAVVGFAGLKPTLAAIEAGINIGLANKETLVVAGSLVMEKAKEREVAIIPIDSEHSAIFQCLQGEGSKYLHRIVLTASGGPFRNYTKDQLADVTKDQALRHPNWSMGAKITIDSATLMNKGLEVLEAYWLFGLPMDKVEVLVHPQSIVHSLVEFVDGSYLAQLGPPDMRLPILYALAYPERVSNSFGGLDLIGQELNFFAPDQEKFPCIAYAYEAGQVGGTMPTVLNAVNEVAVAAFLDESIGFMDIPRLIRTVLDSHELVAKPQLPDILRADAWARQTALGFID